MATLRPSIRHLVLIAMTLWCVMPMAYAVSDCDLSLKPGLANSCPIGAIGAATANASYKGATIAPHSDARTAIDAFGYCRYVGNAGDTPQFVPFADAEEWRGFLTNHPPTVYFVQCSRGGSVAVPPNTGHDPNTNQCNATSPLQSVIVPYKPANLISGYTAPAATYACTSADGTPFTETATASFTAHDSGYGPSDDIGWAISKILYTYDGKCGAANGVITQTAPTDQLCSVGVPSPVIGIGPFTWVCAGGTSGGKNITCSSGTPCGEPRKLEEKTCSCEGTNCYRPIIWGDACGHTWLDKSAHCDAAEPHFAPLPAYDDDNPLSYPNKPDPETLHH